MGWLQGVKGDAIHVGRGHQAWPNIVLRDGESGFELMSSSQGFDHCCREVVTERAMPLLQLRHRPSQIAQVKDVDLRGKCNQLGAEPCLLFGRQSQHRRGELSRDAWIRKGTAQPK